MIKKIFYESSEHKSETFNAPKAQLFLDVSRDLAESATL